MIYTPNGGAQRLAPAGVPFCLICPLLITSKKHDSKQVRCSDLFYSNYHPLILTACFWISPIAILQARHQRYRHLHWNREGKALLGRCYLGAMLFFLLPSTRTDIRLPGQHGFSPFFPDKKRSTGPFPTGQPAGWILCLLAIVYSIT